MICSNCSAENRSDAKFCGRCGTRLGCPRCGAPIVAGAAFCDNCGTRLIADDEGGTGSAATSAATSAAGAAASKASTASSVAARGAAAPPATERRVVNVLFADLVGFTTLSATRDPETIREIQSQYFARTREIVDRYGGIVEKFIGDAVMAMWGAPTAHEDDAERAVRAALDLVDMVPVLGKETGVDLQLRAGVLTGEAAVQLGAESEGMVAGDMVNTASRLQSAAAPGTVLVGEATRLAARDAIAFEFAGEQELKGKPAPVPAWRALRIVSDRGGARRTDAIEPPFVGRSEELRFLKEQFHATGRDVRARLVSLVGQAGIGKSRLAWELEKYLDGVVDNVWWHRGRSPSYGEGVTFWALSEMFRRRAGLVEGDDEETTRRAIGEMVRQHVPEETERAWIEPRILALLGVEEAPAGGAAELFAAWRTFFERLAMTSTVALVIEDLQWSDDGLLDFLEHLLDWGRSSPIFVLTLARPELLDRRPGWGTDRRGATAMRLDPLTDDAMRELLDAMGPGLPDRVVRRILERAGGIPLYAVETIRMLVAKGHLVERDGHYETAATDGGGGLTVDTLEVPPTLHALVAARLDALSAEDRSLLQDAATLGQTFTLEALSALSGEVADKLEPRLAALVRREILTLETDPRAPTRGQHAFVQAIVREVAFSTLSKRERRARHLAAARYFESLGEDEVAGVVATHFVAAYRAAPEGPEAEAIAGQARISLVATADRASELGAPGQAAEALTSALEVTPDPGQRANLLDRIGFLNSFRANWDAAHATLTAAVEAYTNLGDRTGAMGATAHLILAALNAGQIVDAERTAAAASDEIEAIVAAALDGGAIADSAAGEVAAVLAEAMGRLEFRRFRNAEAVLWSDRCLTLAEPLRLHETVAMALVTKGSATANMGKIREGVALLEGAVADASAHRENIAMLRGLNNLASMTVATDPRGSLERTKLGMATARRLGLRSFDTYNAGNAVGAAEPLGEWAWVHDAVSSMLEDTRDRGDAGYLESLRDTFTVWTGNPDVARLERQLEGARTTRDFQAERNIASHLARCAFAAGDVARALTLTDAYLGMALEGDAAEFDWVCRFALHAGRRDVATAVVEKMGVGPGGMADHQRDAMHAGIAALEGRRDDAVRLYRSALAGYRSYGARFALAMAIFDMAKLLGPDDPAVRPMLDEGRGILEDLSAAPLLALFDELVAGTTRDVSRAGARDAGAAIGATPAA